MRFVEPCNGAMVAKSEQRQQRQELFTTTTTTMAQSTEEDLHALLAAESAVANEFFFGYRTRAEALANDALVLLPKPSGVLECDCCVDGIGDEEGDMALGSLWLEGEELEHALEALALLEALPYACGEEASSLAIVATTAKNWSTAAAVIHNDDHASKDLPDASNNTIVRRPRTQRLRSRSTRTRQVRVQNEAQCRGAITISVVPDGRRIGAKKPSQRLQHHGRRSLRGRVDPMGASGVKLVASDCGQPRQTFSPIKASPKPKITRQAAPTKRGAAVPALAAMRCGNSIARISCGPLKRNDDEPHGKIEEVSLQRLLSVSLKSALSFAVSPKPAAEFRSPFSFLHGNEEEANKPKKSLRRRCHGFDQDYGGYGPHVDPEKAVDSVLEADCSAALERMFAEAL
jgi:hypothetical protein